jgi:hypothetical protein
VIPGEGPAVLIVLPFEAVPQVRCEYLNSGDEERMLDWLGAHPELLELVSRALELAEEARAA